jgi:hypothetical protein
MADDDDEITLDDMFDPEPVEEGDSKDKKDAGDGDDIDGFKLDRAAYDKQQKELDDLKNELSGLKNRPVPSVPAVSTGGGKSFEQEVEEEMQRTGSIAKAISFAAEKAYEAGKTAARAQSIPIAAQTARMAISKFVDDTPMTPSERKEFDAIFATATDDILGNMSHKQLMEALDGAADMAAGKVARKTRNTRGNEPPKYSTGYDSGTSGAQRTPGKKPKLSKDQQAAIEMAKEAGLSKKDLEDIFGGTE